MRSEGPGIILHVDDDRQVRDSISMLLGAEGYTVVSATSGAEALRLVARDLRPDLLIVDFGLEEEMNGADVAEQIRRTLGYTQPIIMLTGDPANAEFPWLLGAPIWLARKPMNPKWLLAAVPSLVQLSRATRELS